MSLRDIFRGEVDYGGDKVFCHEDTVDGFPFLGWFSNQQTNALHGHLHHLGRVGKGMHLNQLLLLDELDNCGCKTKMT